MPDRQAVMVDASGALDAAFTMKLAPWTGRVQVEDLCCTDAECSCAEITLRFWAPDEEGALGGKRLVAELVVDSEDWTIVKVSAVDPQLDVDVFLKRFRRVFRTKQKKAIRQRWEDLKQYGDRLRRPIDSRMLDSGYDVMYLEVFQSINAGRFLFVDDKQHYLVADAYCTNPQCRCNDVVLYFFTGPRANVSEVAFTIKLNYRTMKYELLGNERDLSQQEINRLYRRFVEQLEDPKLGLLKERHRRIKRVGQAFSAEHQPAAEAPSDPKVGRNAPCPCGSGKKYKKCCGV